MDAIFTFSDLQHLILVKLCLFVFIAGGVICIWKKIKPVYFLLFAGLCCGAGYYFLTQGMQLMFWGLTGDEITIAGMYEMFAHGPFWSDFAYTQLPPFYPPLYFWLFGQIGRWFDFNGVQLAKLGALTAIIFFPVILYLVQKLYWSKINQKSKDDPGELSWFLAPLFIFALLDWDAIILKPYEMISAMLIILWGVFLLNSSTPKGCAEQVPSSIIGLNRKKILWFGITGGVLFLLFYFWFFLVAIGVALVNLFGRSKIALKQYLSLGIIGGLILLIAVPFWWPLALSYSRLGAENWQMGFLTVEWLATPKPWLEGMVRGIIGLSGLFALIFFRRRIYGGALLGFFVSAYVWQLMGYFTILFFASPLQESKGFYFFNRAILALAGAYLIEQIYRWLSTKNWNGEWKRSVALFGLLIISLSMIFGSFVDEAKIYGVRQRALSMEKPQRELVEYLKKEHPNSQSETYLHSSLIFLPAFLPFNNFVYFNQHNSHPAANFSDRYNYVRELAQAKTAKEFYDKITNTPFGRIDLLIFYTGDKDYYPIYFHLDDFPHRFKEEIVNIPRGLITKEFFTPVFSNRDFQVFLPTDIDR